VKGLYLNTPPKPKQAKTVELQEAEQLELEDDMSLEEENKGKVVNRSSELEAATEWKPGRTLVAACMVCMVAGAGPAGVAMECKRHRHGPWSGTGSHNSHRSQGL
jgi:hypothetical protein